MPGVIIVYIPMPRRKRYRRHRFKLRLKTSTIYSIFAFGLIVAGLILLLSFTKNGTSFVFINNLLDRYFGATAFLFPFILIFFGFLFLKLKLFLSGINVSIGFLLFFLSLDAFVRGGVVGRELFGILSDILTDFGARLVYFAGILVGLIVFFNTSVDQMSGEELESFVLRDRQKLSEAGIIIILAEVNSANGQLVGNPDIIVRGFTYDIKRLSSRLMQDFHKVLNPHKGRVTNWIYMRKLIGETAERRIFKDLRRRPLVLPVVIEV